MMRAVVVAFVLACLLTSCATYDRAASTDYSIVDRTRVSFAVSAPDPTPGAGRPGGSGNAPVVRSPAPAR
jgi:hypothetical protein